MVDIWILGRAALRLRFSSPTLLLAPHRLWAYVCARKADGDDGDGEEGGDDGVGDGDHRTRST